jgi:hypothetical protein
MFTARSYSVELTAPSTSPLMVFIKIFLLRSILLTLSQDLTKYKSATGGVVDANTGLPRITATSTSLSVSFRAASTY